MILFSATVKMTSTQEYFTMNDAKHLARKYNIKPLYLKLNRSYYITHWIYHFHYALNIEVNEVIVKYIPKEQLINYIMDIVLYKMNNAPDYYFRLEEMHAYARKDWHNQKIKIFNI